MRHWLRVAEAFDLADGARGELIEDLLSDRTAGGVGVLVIDRADLLGAQPGDLHFDVPLVGGPRRGQARFLPVGEVLRPGAQDIPDPVQRVVLAAAVAVDLLLNPAADIVNDRGREFEHVEGVQDRAGVLQLVIDAFLYPRNGSSVATLTRNCSPRSCSQVAYASPDRPGTRSSSRALTIGGLSGSVGWGCLVRSTIPVNSLGPRPLPCPIGRVDT